ncbi:uncharacterized protein MELLADRAFT_60820 [Melampsora larici-populina 98AG31]|uniref:Uncharacterized protein n=1 Tax=Melampsora larici-populina (strain 98AG31 / pathotype 3-4-7) TaxID=747676 RepID=F4RCH1_MELLP|nr:uncharacterized protein MELLADRAFT_60820 [Melampsora larici-populina 98AG31]EGG09731.1 hypothetical protein MELLADRAFT_60820 [Melampsora larici-populina 98AG31]
MSLMSYRKLSIEIKKVAIHINWSNLPRMAQNQNRLRKQPERKAKLGFKMYKSQSNLSFAAGPRKPCRSPIPGGKIPWVHPKRYKTFYMDNDELPDFNTYVFLPLNRNCKKSTSSQRLRWKREDIREQKDLNRWNQANMAVWRSKQQAESHRHFFFLKGALANVQNYGPEWLFSPADYTLAHQILRESLKAEQYHEVPVENRKQWLEQKMFEARHGILNLNWHKPY